MSCVYDGRTRCRTDVTKEVGIHDDMTPATSGDYGYAWTDHKSSFNASSEWVGSSEADNVGYAIVRWVHA